MPKSRNNPNAHAAKSLQSCPTLCHPTDGSPPASPVPGILQARTPVGCHFLLQCVKVKHEREVAQSCPTLHDPMDCSPSGSSVHGIFQARVLEWGAIAFSPNVHKWILKVHTIEYYSAISKNEVLIGAAIWITLLKILSRNY